MNQEKIQEIIDLEQKFQRLSDKGHPNVMDNGFFLDAVFNVTALLKKNYNQLLSHGEGARINFDKEVEIISHLYNSLESFEELYTDCLMNDENKVY